MAQRGQHGKCRVRGIGDVIGKVGAGARWLATRLAAKELQAGNRTHGQPVTQVVGLRSAVALHGHRQIDHARVDLAQRLVSQPQPLHGSRREVVRHDVGVLDQAQCQGTRLWTFQIQRDAALAGVAVSEVPAAIDAGPPVLERLCFTQRIQAIGAFDLDHVGAKIRKQLGGEGSGSDPGKVDYRDPGQGTRAVQVFAFHPVTPARSNTCCACHSYPSVSSIWLVCSPRRGAGRPACQGVPVSR
ncbi:hypothetical protein D3C87_1291290 [compost metagenome]